MRNRTKHPLYNTWNMMKQRCYNEDCIRFDRYGARGIFVCDRWLDIGDDDGFANFLADMGERPDGCTLDRIDNEGPYCKENCRWATLSEQCMNRSRPKLSIEKVAEIKRRILDGGPRGYLTRLAREYGISQPTISQLKSGYTGAHIPAA